jgi:hypothetical protein
MFLFGMKGTGPGGKGGRNEPKSQGRAATTTRVRKAAHLSNGHSCRDSDARPGWKVLPVAKSARMDPGEGRYPNISTAQGSYTARQEKGTVYPRGIGNAELVRYDDGVCLVRQGDADAQAAATTTPSSAGLGDGIPLALTSILRLGGPANACGYMKEDRRSGTVHVEYTSIVH